MSSKIEIYDNLLGAEAKAALSQVIARALEKATEGTPTYSLNSEDEKKIQRKFVPTLTGTPLDKIGCRLVVSGLVSWTANVPKIHHHNAAHNALLYYSDVAWEPQWYGGTIWIESKAYVDMLVPRIVKLSPYVPGRLVLFPAEMLHSILPTVDDAPKNRTTLTLFFDKEK